MALSLLLQNDRQQTRLSPVLALLHWIGSTRACVHAGVSVCMRSRKGNMSFCTQCDDLKYTKLTLSVCMTGVFSFFFFWSDFCITLLWSVVFPVRLCQYFYLIFLHDGPACLGTEGSFMFETRCTGCTRWFSLGFSQQLSQISVQHTNTTKSS